MRPAGHNLVTAVSLVMIYLHDAQRIDPIPFKFNFCLPGLHIYGAGQGKLQILLKLRADAGVSGNIRAVEQTPFYVTKRVIAGSLEAWTGMRKTEPARRAGVAALDPAHGYRPANLAQGE